MLVTKHFLVEGDANKPRAIKKAFLLLLNLGEIDFKIAGC